MTLRETLGDVLEFPAADWKLSQSFGIGIFRGHLESLAAMLSFLPWFGMRVENFGFRHGFRLFCELFPAGCYEVLAGNFGLLARSSRFLAEILSFEFSTPYPEFLTVIVISCCGQGVPFALLPPFSGLKVEGAASRTVLVPVLDMLNHSTQATASRACSIRSSELQLLSYPEREP
eukprot:6213524-Pleurochrysis_carterae.AAC.1